MESEHPPDGLPGLERLDRPDDFDWVDCPECGLPAYVVDRFVRPSTDGPLPHAATVCARLHRLCTTDESTGLPAPAPAPAEAEPAAEESAGSVEAESP